MAGSLRILAASAALGLGVGLGGLPARGEDFGALDAFTASDFSAVAGDSGRLNAALAALAKGQAGLAEALAGALRASPAHTAYAWAKLRRAREPALSTLDEFARAHPDWAGQGWLRAEIEAELFRTQARPAVVLAAFAEQPPQTPIGRYALARAMRAEGDVAGASDKIRELWRESADETWLENALIRNEAALLTKGDDMRRSERLLYAGRFSAALRAAARAGADILANASRFVAAARGVAIPSLSPTAPGAASLAPGMMLAEAREARREKRLEDAARWFALAPNQAKALGDPDAWWEERRQLVRSLLDAGFVAKAYDLAAGVSAGSPATISDAHFRAGWIALRFKNDPAAAAAHFAASGEAFDSDAGHARADYWSGRALATLGDPDGATRAFKRAARAANVYYGQLAAVALGRPLAPATAPLSAAEGEARDESIQVAEQLFAAGQPDLAVPLSFAAIGRLQDAAQAAALAALMERYADAPTRLAFGRMAMARGFVLQNAAFPLDGVPDAAPLAHSADRPAVLAVMRQESGFIAHAASGAGAHGLMQLLPGTAREAARRAGVPFDEKRFAADPSFNVQLGGAYLGQLLEDLGGQMPIALAAYNAGPARVEQWFQLYGDPRRGQTDMVDWVERIPFDETREYVQRVSEAIGVYRARLTPPTAIQAGEPLQVAAASANAR